VVGRWVLSVVAGDGDERVHGQPSSSPVVVASSKDAWGGDGGGLLRSGDIPVYTLITVFLLHTHFTSIRCLPRIDNLNSPTPTHRKPPSPSIHLSR